MTNSHDGFGRKVWAVLGPTNTGKTHLALERMMASPSGMIGLPLRLLARELYDRVVAKKGVQSVALVTGEERIWPKNARYILATTEAMPLEFPASFIALDEVQLAADPDRGHVFTDRIIHVRGLDETLFLGAETIKPILRALIPNIQIERRDRLSQLNYRGAMRLNRLPPRSAIVAFSAEDVYSIAELIRRHRGGAAVVMGALSPRTRNAQVELFQSGEVDFLVATDAIGMGLNMNVAHVGFAALHKFDGRQTRPLRPDEMGQIAGRAGRHVQDGTFGETGTCEAFEPDWIERIEAHTFEAHKHIYWRSRNLDFANAKALISSLDVEPPHVALRRVRGAIDEAAFLRLSQDEDFAAAAKTVHGTRILWDLCQLPDFRRASLDEHVRLLREIGTFLLGKSGKMPKDYISRKVSNLDRLDGDIEQLQQRLAQVRVWAYGANRRNWMETPEVWQEATRAIENRLSDQLHARLRDRFVDQRTSALIRGLRQEHAMPVEITEEGLISVDGHDIGRINGLSIALEVGAEALEEKAIKQAATQALRPILATRIKAMLATPALLSLTADGHIIHGAMMIARLGTSEHVLEPKIALIGAELADDSDRASLTEGLENWLKAEVAKELAVLGALKVASEDANLAAPVRALAYRLNESHGLLDRKNIRAEIEALSPDDRRALRGLGVRFGRAYVHLPILLKPKPARLLAILSFFGKGKVGMPVLPPGGLTSFDAGPEVSADDLALIGYKVMSGRAVRIDILDRAADALYEAMKSVGGACEMPLMVISLLGVSNERAEDIVAAMGWQKSIGPKPVVKPVEVAEVAPVTDAATTPEVASEEIAAPDAEVVETASDVVVEAIVEALTEAPVEAIVESAPEVAAAPETVTEEAVAAPEMVTLWRPVRPAKPRFDNQRRQGQGGERSNYQGRNHSRDGQNHSGAKEGDNKNPAGERVRRFNQGQNQGGPNAGGRRDGAREGSRDGARVGNRNGGKPPFKQRSFEAGPNERSSKGIDPNNPFAVLAALKNQGDAKDGKK